MQFYVQSISLAKKNNFIHEEALAYEKAAMFLYERKKEHSARLFLLQAYETYLQWGATAKVMQIRGLYPSLLATFNSFHSSFSPTAGIPLDICVNTSAESSLISECTSIPNQIISEHSVCFLTI